MSLENSGRPNPLPLQGMFHNTKHKPAATGQVGYEAKGVSESGSGRPKFELNPPYCHPYQPGGPINGTDGHGFDLGWPITA